MGEVPASFQPDITEYNGEVIGFDVCGFSNEYKKLKREFGPQAGEIISARLIKGDSAFSKVVSQLGFEFAETTGDGALYIKRSVEQKLDAGDAKKLLNEASMEFTRTSGLPIRTGHSTGWIKELILPHHCSESQTFRYGSAISGIHDELSNAIPTSSNPIPNIQSSLVPQVRDPLSLTRKQFCICIQVLGSTEVTDVNPSSILSVCSRCYEWISSFNGTFERISFDEKGVLIRISCDRHSSDAEELEKSLESLIDAISNFDIQARVSLSYGSIYRGTSPEGRLFVHGEPINVGTKILTQTEKRIVLSGPFPANDKNSPALSHQPRVPSGRNSEIKQINAVLSDAGFQICAVIGERGIGKSTLINHFSQRKLEQNRTVCSIRCSPSNSFKPLGVIVEIIHSSIDKLVSEKPVSRLEKEIVSQIRTDDIDIDHLFLLKEILPAGFFENTVEGAIERTQKLSVMMDYASSVMKLLSSHLTMLVIIDECHLIDPESEEIFQNLGQNNANLKMLLATRDEFECRLIGLPVVSSSVYLLKLDPLSGADLLKILISLNLEHCGDIEAVIKVSGGNPFYAIQSAFAQVEGISSKHRPLNDVVKERLGLLSREQMLILRLVCFFDRPISKKFIEKTVSYSRSDQAEIDEFENLARLNFIQPSPSDIELLEVSHGLVSQCLAEISPNGAVSSTFELLSRSVIKQRELFGEARLEPHEIALLWEKAISYGRAAIFYSRAAELAEQKGFFRSSAALYDKALNLLAESNRTSASRLNAWRVEKAECLWAIGEVSSADATVKQCRENEKFEVDKIRASDTRARAAIIEAETSYFTGEFFDLLMAQWRLGKYNLSEGTNELARVRGYASLAYTAGIFRLLPLAHFFADRATQIGLKINHGRSVAHGLAAKGLLFFVFGKWEEGEIAFNAALSHLTHNVDEHHLYEVIETLLGLGAHQQGKTEATEYHFSNLKKSAVSRGHKLHAGWTEYSMASSHLSQGDAEKALHHIQLADPLIAGKGDAQSQHICAGLHARIHWDLNQLDEAEKWARKAHNFSKQLPPRNFSSVEAYAAAPMVFALLGRREAADIKTMKAMLKPLASYAMIFPTARPRYHLVKAIVWESKNQTKYQKHLCLSRDLAKKYGIGSDHNLQSKFSSRSGEVS